MPNYERPNYSRITRSAAILAACTATGLFAISACSDSNSSSGSETPNSDTTISPAAPATNSKPAAPVPFTSAAAIPSFDYTVFIPTAGVRSDAGVYIPPNWPVTPKDAGVPPNPDSGTKPPQPNPDAAPPADVVQPPEASIPDHEAPPTICQYVNGNPIPYDHTMGIMQDFSLNLYSDCRVGGFMEPLVTEDPDLPEVTKFNARVTNWFRAILLQCADTPLEGSDKYALVPPPPSGLTNADFDAVNEVFLGTIATRDGLSDGLTPEQKTAIQKRLESYRATVVTSHDTGFTKPSTTNPCPIEPADAGSD